MENRVLQVTNFVIFGTDPSTVCTCLVVRKTPVPMHNLQLQVLYPIKPDLPLKFEGNT